MIKNYKIFKESLLNKLEGPKEEEFLNTIKENPIKYYSKAYFNKDEEIKKISGDLITPEIKKETVYKLIDGIISLIEEDFYWKGLIYYDKKYNIVGIYGLPYDDWKLYLINKFDKNEYASIRKKLYNIYKDSTMDEIVRLAYKSFIDLEK